MNHEVEDIKNEDIKSQLVDLEAAEEGWKTDFWVNLLIAKIINDKRLPEHFETEEFRQSAKELEEKIRCLYNKSVEEQNADLECKAEETEVVG